MLLDVTFVLHFDIIQSDYRDQWINYSDAILSFYLVFFIIKLIYAGL